MNKGVIVVVLALALGVGGFLARDKILVNVENNWVGVRINNIPVIHKVAEDTIVDPGWHVKIPHLYEVQLLPAMDVVLEMDKKGGKDLISTNEMEQAPTLSSNLSSYDPNAQMDRINEDMAALDQIRATIHDPRTGGESLRINTADGNYVWVPIVVKFSLDRKHASQALIKFGVLDKEQSKAIAARMPANTSAADLKIEEFKELVSPTVNSMTRGIVGMFLGSLTTEQIMDQSQLAARVNDSKTKLNKVLQSTYGLVIKELSVPSKITNHPDYQTIIDQTQAAEEKTLKYNQETIRATLEKDTNIARAKGESDAMIALANGRKARRLLEAKSREIAMGYEAEAMRVKYENLAEGIAAMTSALSAPGGDAHVGLAISEALQDKRIFIVPADGSVNMLNVNELLQTYAAGKSLTDKPDEEDAEDKPMPTPEPAEPNLETSDSGVTDADEKEATGIMEDEMENDKSGIVEDGGFGKPINSDPNPEITNSEMESSNPY